MSEFLHCRDCGYIGPNEDNDLSASDLMDQVESGDLEWDDYQDLLAGTRFACPNCSSLDTEVS